MTSNPPPLQIHALKVACATCSLRELCLPMDLSEDEIDRLEDLIGQRRWIRQGQELFGAGESFHALYAVRSGFFKTCVGSEDGREQVTGFQMAGELLGLDGIGSGRHEVSAVALEDSQVCVMPFDELEEMAAGMPHLQRSLHRFLSREIVRDHGTLLMLGSLRADERVAAFLLGLLRRLQRRGQRGDEFVLRMSREEIGSYLGLKIETVSRVFGRLQAEGLLEVKLKQIRVLEGERLRQLAEGCS
ncbi:MAG: fumarate/nitrate reduction transcriptional regulator Fnr [Pseudomonadota bacterium]